MGAGPDGFRRGAAVSRIWNHDDRNLHGTTTQLEWKRRIANGDLLGPTIYTSGEHVNEPRVNTPAEARQEVEAQAREGYDVIKFHEVWNRVDGRLTKTGLSRPTYIEMNETARQIGIPIVGHAPVNLGFDALLEGRQPLAHIQALFPIYFLPLSSSRGILFANAAALLVLTSMPLMWTVRGRRRGRDTATRDADVPTHERMLTGLLLVGGLVALSVQLDEYFRSSLARTTLLTVFLVLTVFVAAVTVAMIVLVMRACRQPSEIHRAVSGAGARSGRRGCADGGPRILLGTRLLAVHRQRHRPGGAEPARLRDYGSDDAGC